MTREEKWLLEWLAGRGPLPKPRIADNLPLNYFEAGLIDSFGVIELITDIENEFGIRFNETHFQDRRFAVVSGLAKLVRELYSTAEEA